MKQIITFLALLVSVNAMSGIVERSAHAVDANSLVVTQDGKSLASVVVAADAGTWEKKAGEDLVKYIEMMSGARPQLVTRAANAALPDGPVIVIGRAALESDASLQQALTAVAKKNPVARADAIVMRRKGNRVYLAGTNDESHYFAVTQLLQDWGCRWYLPTDFGECIPEQPTLTIGTLDRAYAPPFEIRHYWLSWNADSTGANEFRRRNFMTETSLAGMGHALGQYTQKLVPTGKTMFNVPLADEATAKAVAAQIEPEYAKGVPGISLAIEDGNYVSDAARDKELQAGITDKYALQPSNTDAMMTLYNNVARILHEKYPNSKTKIGGMAYANVTIPPQQVTSIEPNVVMWLAPIDIDPNHSMDDPNSPPRQEYRAILERWAQLTSGRLSIYDYDQGQLVWRDIPNPSQFAFAGDVKHYRDAGILGVGTESRGATATTFLNLFFRGQLMWNPDADVKALLTEFYPKFYGPGAAPMAQYWDAIFAAWEHSPITEHEYFVAPAIYTPQLVASLKAQLAQAQQAMAPLRAKANPTRNEKLYLERMHFTELSFAVLENYMAMVQAAAGQDDYKTAVAAGERGLAAREELTKMNPTFTTYKNIGENGAAWWPGEVQQMRDLATLTDGTKGTLIASTPLAWVFHRDPHDTGLARGWYYQEATLPPVGDKIENPAANEWGDNAGWEMRRADIYLQGQGLRNSDRQSYTGHYWYQTPMELKADQTTGKVHLLFPGLFNECWLYVNGILVGYRPFSEPWWRNDYKFEWDIDLTGKLKPGHNTFTLRGFNPHHFGGMFRRPFLYRAK